jgi:hypothetical protein
MKAKDPGQPVCLNCMQPTTVGTHFCVHCGAPLTAYATTGPYEQILAGGFAYRQASSSANKPIVLFGMWLLFGPALVILLVLDLVAVANIRDIVASVKDFSSAVRMIAAGVMFGGMTYISAALLYKTTKNYLAHKNVVGSASESESEEEESDDPRFKDRDLPRD